MGHCISAYLIKKSDLRDSKINSIILDINTNEDVIKWLELPFDLLMTTYIPNIRKFGYNKTIAVISTDYFGGAGEQSAKLFENNKKVYDSNELDYSRGINKVLKFLGVESSDGCDEFDTIGLSRYRSNSDIEDAILVSMKI